MILILRFLTGLFKNGCLCFRVWKSIVLEEDTISEDDTITSAQQSKIFYIRVNSRINMNFK